MLLGSKIDHQIVVEKISNFLNQYLPKVWLSVSEKKVDGFYAEIHHLEQGLSQSPSRPTLAVRKHPKILEPITEQQKIMDMSG